MSAIKWLICSECHEARWAAEGTVCIVTIGCTGKMVRPKDVDLEQQALFADGEAYAQLGLFNE